MPMPSSALTIEKFYKQFRVVHTKEFSFAFIVLNLPNTPIVAGHFWVLTMWTSFFFFRPPGPLDWLIVFLVCDRFRQLPALSWTIRLASHSTPDIRHSFLWTHNLRWISKSLRITVHFATYRKENTFSLQYVCPHRSAEFWEISGSASIPF